MLKQREIKNILTGAICVRQQSAGVRVFFSLPHFPVQNGGRTRNIKERRM